VEVELSCQQVDHQVVVACLVVLAAFLAVVVDLQLLTGKVEQAPGMADRAQRLASAGVDFLIVMRALGSLWESLNHCGR